MIPLDSTTAILPRMPTGRSITGEFPLTIIKPPALDVKSRSSPSAISSPIYRLVRSSNQRRNSSASSLRSSCSIKPECKEFVTERVEVFELKDTVRHSHVESLLLQCENQDTCTFPSNIGMYREKTPYFRRNSLISLAKDRRISIQDNPLELTKEVSEVDEDEKQCSTTDLKTETKTTENSFVMESKIQNENSSVRETKQSESSPSEKVNKRNRKKSCKAKKTTKKRKNSVKKGPGVSVFARLVANHGQKKQQGQIVNSNEQTKSRAMTDTSPSKYLNIQKLCAAYAPKKNENKNNALLLPRVSNTSLTKDNLKSCTPSPRKQELEDVPVSPSLSSPRKLINSDDDKVKKIYLSEAHSGMITGIPCAPPSTPTVDELKKVEYVPSLTDVKSQRAVKSRLVNIGNKMRAEEQRKKEKAIKEEQKRAYGAILQLKQRQRAEIYALNKHRKKYEDSKLVQHW